MRIQIVISAYDASTYYRLVLPADAMEADIVTVKPDDPRLGDADIVWFCRYGLTDFTYARRKGAKIVMDLDDYWHLYPSHVLFQSWKDLGIPKMITDNLKRADMVFCTSNTLRTSIREYNSNVHTIYNALPYGVEQFTPEVRPMGSPLTFLWAGGASHLTDLRMMQDSLRRISKDDTLKNSMRFVLGGASENDVWTKIKSLFDITGVAEYRDALPLHMYMDVYKEADIVFAPLANNVFNRHKSFLKVLEAAVHKKPILVSGVRPYTDIHPSYVVHVGKSWYGDIKDAVKNPRELMEKAEALHEYCSSCFHLKDWAARRMELFHKLLR